jgi:probable F420-dependent oxidoreductase
VKFACALAFNPPTELPALARAAETAGFAHVSVSDHVVHPEKIATPYPYTENGEPRWQPFTDWPDPWVMIGAMASVTETIRFYTSIFVLPMRNPFLVSKTVGTAAVISHDRVSLGIGVGWMKEEYALMSQEFRNRGKRCNEMIEVLRLLWSGGMVEYHGEHYDFDRLEMSPVPAEPIPILVGGFSDPALRRAAHYGDGWISDLHTTAELQALIQRLGAFRSESARADEPFEVFASVSDAYDLTGYRRLRDIGVDHLVTIPWIFYGGATDDLQQKLDGIARFGDEVIARLDG